jgi:hypothetical protein
MVRSKRHNRQGPGRLSPEDRLLICCAGERDDEGAGRRDGEVLSPQIHWDALVEKGLRHGVASLLHSYLSTWDTRHEVPIGISRRLENIYYANAMRAVRAEEQLSDILSCLGENGVEAILLKGLFLSESVYKNIALRPIGDIDLLIHRDDIARTDSLLHGIGFMPAPGSFPLRYYREVHFHAMYVRDSGPGSIPVEVHWGLQDRFNLLRMDMDEIWSRVRPWSIGRHNIPAMCPEDLLTYLCYHADKHTCFSRYIEDFSHIGPEAVLGNTVSAELLWYADILRLIHLEGHAITWDHLAERCRRWGIEGEVYASLAVTDTVFGTSIAGQPLSLLEPPRTGRLQAAVYRRLMRPRSLPDGVASEDGARRQRLLESGGGLQFRPFRLFDISDYIFPDPDRVSRHFAVTGSKLHLRYMVHVLTATFHVISSVTLLIGSVIWRSVARPSKA